MLPHDTLNDHHAQTVALFLGGIVGKENLGDILLCNAHASVGKLHVDIVVVPPGHDPDMVPLMHGFQGIFQDIEKNLFNLICIALDDRILLLDLDLYFQVSILQLHALHLKNLVQYLHQVQFLRVRRRWA